MLKDLVVQKQEWKGITPYLGKDDSPAKLRGLTPADVAKVMASHRESFTKIFEGEVSFESAIITFPELIAYVIALAAGEEDSWEAIMEVPAGIQLEALDIIWNLSHLDEHNLGKLFAGLGDLMEKWRGQTMETGQVSESGNSVSHEPSTDYGREVEGV